jgi:hypothetical protein
LPQTHQGASQLRLKRGDRNNENGDKKALIEILEPFEMVSFGNKIEDEDARDENIYNAAEKSLAACAFEKIYRPVNNNPNEKQLNADDPPVVVGDSPEVIDEGLHPCQNSL